MNRTLNDRFTFRALDAAARPRRFYEYYVTGKGVFPFDMLRYDRAWPATGEDAAMLEWSRVNPERYGASRRTVKIWSYNEPTVERWHSFSWSVSTVKPEVIDEKAQFHSA